VPTRPQPAIRQQTLWEEIHMTYTNPQGHRQCRTCKRASDNRRNARLRDKIEDAA